MRVCAGQGAISKGFARCAKRMPRLPQKQPRDFREAASGVGAARANELDEIAPTSPSTCARFLLLFLKKKPPPGRGGERVKRYARSNAGAGLYKAGRCPTRRETARWISLRASKASPPTRT